MHETFLYRIIKNQYLNSLENEAWIKVLRFHIHSTCIDNRSDRIMVMTCYCHDGVRPMTLIATAKEPRSILGVRSSWSRTLVLNSRWLKAPCWILGSFDGRPIWTLFCRGRVISTQLPVAGHLRASSFGQTRSLAIFQRLRNEGHFCNRYIKLSRLVSLFDASIIIISIQYHQNYKLQIHISVSVSFLSLNYPCDVGCLNQHSLKSWNPNYFDGIILHFPKFYSSYN